MKKEKIYTLPAIKASPKTGHEALTFEDKSTGYTLLDFWRWSVSDILINITRGRFAEFIVGTALGLNPENLREEWDAFDIESEDGIKIEIKSAAYIQSWDQDKYSKITFSIKKVKHWDAPEGNGRGIAKRHAHVYVFCLLKVKDQNIIDPLKLEQWEFYVLPTHALENYSGSQNQMLLSKLQSLTPAIQYNELKASIQAAYEAQIAIPIL